MTITRKQIWLAALVAVALASIGAASPAHAEIIDFNPAVDDVPEILQPDEIELLDQAASSEFLALLAVPNPSGEYLYASRGDARGAIELLTGAFTELPVETQGQPYLNATWRAPATLLQLYVYVHEPDDAPAEIQYFMLEWDVAVGMASFDRYDVSSLGGEIISAGPGYYTFLVVELPEEAPGPVTVDLGPVYGPERDEIPEGAPGVVGRHPFGPMALQQAEFTLTLVTGTDTRHELATYPLDTGIAGATWSEDGSRVSVVTRTMPGWRNARPRRNEPIWPGTPNLGSIPVQEALGNIPPAENPLVMGTKILVAEVATGDTLKTIQNTGFPQGTLLELAFSPSNTRALLVVATRSSVEGRTHPTYAFPNGAEFHLLDADLNVEKQLEAPGLELLAGTGAFAGDDMALFAVADEVDHRLIHYNFETDAAVTVSDEPGAYYQIVTQGADTFLTHASVDEPPELWVLDGESHGAVPDRLTDFNEVAADSAAELVAEDVSWQASDGETLHGYYVHHESEAYPPAVPGPLVVWQQGGPGGQMLRDYGDTVEAPYGMLPHFGLPVLVANAAGRNVRSRDFYTDMADRRDFGQIDIDQIKEGVDHLVAEGIVHPGRVGVTGCSYGGYFTLQSMRAYPDYYAAGNPQCAMTDLFEEFTFGYAPMVSYLMGASPMAEAEEYLRDSPYHGVKDIIAPVLIFHGTDDFLPVQLQNNIHDELDANDVDVTFLRALSEEHGFSADSSQDYARQLQVQFFRKNLIETDPPLPPRGATVFLPIGLRGELP